MTAELTKALVAFQTEMPTVAKGKRAEVPTKSGGKYTYTYADLADVTEAALPLLAKNGLAFATCPRMGERGFELVGRLLHTSGESIEGSLPIAGNSPQEMGSSLTYMRRYLLGCMTGLVTDDDDDGQLAQNAKPKRKAATTPAEPQQTRTMRRQATAPADSPFLDTSSRLAKSMFAAMGDHKITERADRLAYVSKALGREITSSTQMTDADAELVLDYLNAHAPGQAPPEPPDLDDPTADPSWSPS